MGTCGLFNTVGFLDSLRYHTVKTEIVGIQMGFL